MPGTIVAQVQDAAEIRGASRAKIVAGYISRRMLQGVFVLWAAFTVTFAMLYVLPGDPVSIMLDGTDSGTQADPGEAAALRAELGLDGPWYAQYANHLVGVLQLDLGTSIRTGRPVVDEIAAVLPETAQLAGLALLIAIVGGGTIAYFAVASPTARVRGLLLSLPPLGVAVPTFWIALMLLQLFSFRLGWFPAVGNAGFATLVLPAVTLAIPSSAALAQVLAKSMSATSVLPFVDTARAKGLSRARVYTRHVLRNAVIPALTILGTTVGGVLAGSVVTEAVFSRVGIGRLTESAVQSRDIPVVQGVVLLAAVVFVTVNLVVDLLYPTIDPRISIIPTREESRS